MCAKLKWAIQKLLRYNYNSLRKGPSVKHAFVFALVSVIATSAFASAKFACQAKLSSAGKSITLTSTPSEDYMANGVLTGLTIDTYQNEDGLTYHVQITKSQQLVASADIPFYEDSNLTVATDGKLLIVQCTNK